MHASNSSPWAEMASRETSFNNVCHHAQERPCPRSHARAVLFAFLTPVQKRMCGVRASSRLLLLALAWRGSQITSVPSSSSSSHARLPRHVPPESVRTTLRPKGGSGVLTTLALLGGRANITIVVGKTHGG